MDMKIESATVRIPGVRASDLATAPGSMGRSGFQWDMSHLMSKLTKWHGRPVKTKISLGIRLV